MSRADISALVGRSFVSSRGNVCRVIRLAEGALRVQWKAKPVDSEMDEFKAFAEGVLGPLNVTTHIGLSTERDALSAWLRESNQ